jgi:hypothetical protein
MGDFGRRRADRREPLAFEQLLLQPGLVGNIANKRVSCYSDPDS